MSGRHIGRKAVAGMMVSVAGLALVGVLVFTGSGAPREPARVLAPGEQFVHLEAAGRYVVITEQVVIGRPATATELRTPEVHVEMVRADGTPIPLRSAGRRGWSFKFLTRQRGHTEGVFRVSKSGEVLVRTTVSEPAAPGRHYHLVLAFVPLFAVGRFLWLVIGFGGQAFFSMRFIVQWLASERAGRSVVPRSFWIYSLVGGVMILVYAIHTRDPVFILAYAFNTLIYLRNMALLKREAREPVLTGVTR